MSNKPTPPKPLEQPPEYDKTTGVPLYPYSHNDYVEIELVGQMFENGQYLPVKVFSKQHLSHDEVKSRKQANDGLFKLTPSTANLVLFTNVIVILLLLLNLI